MKLFCNFSGVRWNEMEKIIENIIPHITSNSVMGDILLRRQNNFWRYLPKSLFNVGSESDSTIVGQCKQLRSLRQEVYVQEIKDSCRLIAKILIFN